MKLTKEESEETYQEAVKLALADLLCAAPYFFEMRPDLDEFTVERKDGGARLLDYLPTADEIFDLHADLLNAATDFFALRPDLNEFSIEQRNYGLWVSLPDGSMHALPREADAS